MQGLRNSGLSSRRLSPAVMLQGNVDAKLSAIEGMPI
jgi:hypothetical protein